MSDIDQPDRGAFMPRKHVVQARAKHSQRIQGMLDGLPGLSTAVAAADRAVEMQRSVVEQRDETAVALPKTAEEITDAWLQSEIDRRRHGSDTDARLKLLREIEYDAREQVWSLIEGNAESMLEELDSSLQDLIAQLATAVDALGDVSTAADAISADVSDHWKTAATLRRDYDEIRDVQRTLYRCDSAYFDGLPCGDGDQRIPDPEARLYFHRKIAEVAPGWRGRTENRVTYPGTVPWPADPVEKLVWFVRNDSGIWCPTPAQIAKAIKADQPKSEDSHPGNVAPSKYDEKGRYQHVDQSGAKFGDDAWNTPRSARV